MAHLKLTIRDVSAAPYSNESEAYTCQFYNSADDQLILFRNGRVSGMVVSIMSEVAFSLDDGTGIIPVVIPAKYRREMPKVGEYVEVLGQLKGTINRSISMLSCHTQSDPMEETRRLLEQAAIHRDMAKCRKIANEPKFLSSDSPDSDLTDDFTDKVTDLLMSCDPALGITLERIKTTCLNDEELTNRVICELQSVGVIYQQGSAFFPL